MILSKEITCPVCDRKDLEFFRTFWVRDKKLIELVGYKPVVVFEIYCNTCKKSYQLRALLDVIVSLNDVDRCYST